MRVCLGKMPLITAPSRRDYRCVQYIVETTSDTAFGGFLHFAERLDGSDWVHIYPIDGADLDERVLLMRKGEQHDYTH